jgi:hypothetical protein
VFTVLVTDGGCIETFHNFPNCKLGDGNGETRKEILGFLSRSYDLSLHVVGIGSMGSLNPELMKKLAETAHRGSFQVVSENQLRTVSRRIAATMVDLVPFSRSVTIMSEDDEDLGIETMFTALSVGKDTTLIFKLRKPMRPLTVIVSKPGQGPVQGGVSSYNTVTFRLDGVPMASGPEPQICMSDAVALRCMDEAVASEYLPLKAKRFADVGETTFRDVPKMLDALDEFTTSFRARFGESPMCMRNVDLFKRNERARIMDAGQGSSNGDIAKETFSQQSAIGMGSSLLYEDMGSGNAERILSQSVYTATEPYVAEDGDEFAQSFAFDQEHTAQLFTQAGEDTVQSNEQTLDVDGM